MCISSKSFEHCAYVSMCARLSLERRLGRFSGGLPRLFVGLTRVIRVNSRFLTRSVIQVKLFRGEKISGPFQLAFVRARPLCLLTPLCGDGEQQTLDSEHTRPGSPCSSANEIIRLIVWCCPVRETC